MQHNRLENRTSCNSFSPDFHLSGTFERHVTRYDWPMYRAIGRLSAGESYRVAAPLLCFSSVVRGTTNYLSCCFSSVVRGKTNYFSYCVSAPSCEGRQTTYLAVFQLCRAREDKLLLLLCFSSVVRGKTNYLSCCMFQLGRAARIGARHRACMARLKWAMCKRGFTKLFRTLISTFLLFPLPFQTPSSHSVR